MAWLPMNLPSALNSKPIVSLFLYNFELHMFFIYILINFHYGWDFEQMRQQKIQIIIFMKKNQFPDYNRKTVERV